MSFGIDFSVVGHGRGGDSGRELGLVNLAFCYLGLKPAVQIGQSFSNVVGKISACWRKLAIHCILGQQLDNDRGKF